jgi:sugar/nucleoside kinase (ribokinase family)
VDTLLGRLPAITAQCHTILSFNLKEAWQMGDVFGGEFSGKKDPTSVAGLATFLRERIEVDRVVIHPNDGAACASASGTVYVPGPVCRKPLISTGAGDNFGAGCLSGAMLGLDDIGILLCGVCSSGYFVRTGESPSLEQIGQLIDLWSAGSLPERL